jgi:hypothetical protein
MNVEDTAMTPRRGKPCTGGVMRVHDKQQIDQYGHDVKEQTPDYDELLTPITDDLCPDPHDFYYPPEQDLDL